MKIVFSEGVEKEFEAGITVYDLLQASKEVFAEEELKDAIGLRIDNALLDLQTPVVVGGQASLVRWKQDTDDTKKFYRHSMSHVLAQAVRRLYPDIKLAIGPATDEGFYYDFEVKTPFTPDDLDKIAAEMKKVIKENHRFERLTMTPEEAREAFPEDAEPYKRELLEEFIARGDTVTFYRDGDFIDLCAGPHQRFTNQVKHFKLMDVAGAYWRGDENNTMLQRIYGTAFQKKEDLEQHLWQREEAKKRDHRRLGKDLDLFSTNPETVGGGLVMWHPKGALVRHLIETHYKAVHLSGGYDFVISPHIGRACLWETSGHLDFYKDGMYSAIDIDNQEYYLKPMNCPFHIEIFRSRLKSYRDLPSRYAEWGTVYRYERSGTLHGLARVRGFTQDDAHLFCRADQMPEEIDRVLEFSISLLRDFGFTDFELFLSTRPEKHVGSEAEWDAAESALRASLERSGIPFQVNEGDGAFYGPKIDIYIADALKRKWQLSTVQFDFNLPERFDLTYIGDDGKNHRPVMIHRALLGSLERFFSVLVEHYAGAFPVWLAPVQVSVLPIVEKHQEYAQGVLQQLLEAGVRAEMDASSNTLNYRIRAAQNQKIPYMFVIGDREIEQGAAAVRVRTGDDLGAISIDQCIEMIKEKVMQKAVV